MIGTEKLREKRNSPTWMVLTIFWKMRWKICKTKVTFAYLKSIWSLTKKPIGNQKYKTIKKGDERDWGWNEYK